MTQREFVITSDTTYDEVVEFMEHRLKQSIEVNGSTIFNLSSYDVDEAALIDAIELKLDKEVYVIPHQVTSTWGFMMTVLPERLKNADVLVYATDQNEYRAYDSFYRQMNGSQRAQQQMDFQTLVEEELADG